MRFQRNPPPRKPASSNGAPRLRLATGPPSEEEDFIQAMKRRQRLYCAQLQRLEIGSPAWFQILSKLSELGDHYQEYFYQKRLRERNQTEGVAGSVSGDQPPSSLESVQNPENQDGNDESSMEQHSEVSRPEL